MQIGIDEQDALVSFELVGIKPTPEKMKQLVMNIAEKNLLDGISREIMSVLKNEILIIEQSSYAREGAKRW